MDRRTETGLLLEFYGALLTEKQRDVLEKHLNEDLSLAEIAEQQGVSRQAVRDSIKRGEEQLREYEGALRLMARDMELLKLLDELIKDEKDRAKKQKLFELRERIEGNDGV